MTIEMKVIDNSREAAALIDKLEAEVRGAELVKAVRKAGNLVKRHTIPRITPPGYPGDKKGKAPLRESIIVAVREYQNATVAFVGGAWPQGAHMHLYEFGHIQTRADGTSFHVPPNPALRPAIEETLSQQREIMTEHLRRAVTRVKVGANLHE